MLVALDVDMTLAPVNRPMSRQAADLLARVQSSGATVALVSGKPCAYLAGFARAYCRAEDTPLIGEHGADIWLGATMPSRRLPALVTPEDAASLREARHALEAEFAERLFFQPNHVNVTAFPHIDSGISPSQLRSFVETVEPRGTVLEYCDSIDIVPTGINKGRALIALAEAIGADLEGSVAVGDSESDVAMFGVVAMSICVGENEAARAAATETVSSPEEGLARVLAAVQA